MQINISENICKKCGVAHVKIKKWGLCGKCYQFEYQHGGVGKPENLCDITEHKHEHMSEINFIRNFFQHAKWVHQPATFNLNNNDSYRPDFYDGERNIFIEVAGTRQAFHKNKEKYELFRQIYPLLKLEIRLPGGQELQCINGRYIWEEIVLGEAQKGVTS
jgi:hypothetical protein